jgi:hypothetical protein
MIHKDFLRHYVKYIVKNTFGKKGLKQLVITYSHNNTHLSTNIFNFNGFLICLYASKIQSDSDYYDIHILFFKKQVSNIDIRGMLNDKHCKSKWNFYYYQKDYYQKDLLERICSIKYKPLMVENFYKTVNFIYENLDFSHSNNGYKHNDFNVRIEGIDIRTREINTNLEAMSKIDLPATIEKYNQFKKLDFKNVVLNINGNL